MVAAGPRLFYLHGFASGPGSAKGVALARHFADRGAAVERLDLRVPSMEHLRASAMIERVREAIGGPADRAVVFGSSLGGLTAARVASLDARVFALVLLAPAFRIAEGWRRRLGPSALEAWERDGSLEVDDYVTKGKARVDIGFLRDLDRLDAELGPVPDVRVPTLVVHGVRDDVVPVAVSRELAAGRRHVRLVEVDDGHELVASLPRIAALAEEHLATVLGGERAAG